MDVSSFYTMDISSSNRHFDCMLFRDYSLGGRWRVDLHPVYPYEQTYSADLHHYFEADRTHTGSFPLHQWRWSATRALSNMVVLTVYVLLWQAIYNDMHYMDIDSSYEWTSTNVINNFLPCFTYPGMEDVLY